MTVKTACTSKHSTRNLFSEQVPEWRGSNFQGVLELYCDAGTAGVALWLGCSEEAHHEDQAGRHLGVYMSGCLPGNVLSSRSVDTLAGVCLKKEIRRHGLCKDGEGYLQVEISQACLCTVFKRAANNMAGVGTNGPSSRL